MTRRNAHIIYIENEQEGCYFSFAMRRLLKAAVAAVLLAEDYRSRAEVSITLVDDARIRELNRKYRHVDRPTDVLSFPTGDSEEDPSERAVPLGDIVISLERAYRQAAEYGHSPEREVAFLCVHSMLHLLGYDHESSKEDEAEMFSRQEMILSAMGLARS